MPSRRSIPYDFGIFFITFTCSDWMPLIEITNGYDVIYKWFDLLKTKTHYILGYVIMPNHVHVLIAFRKTDQNINTIIGNGKRFMAYEIIDRLQKENKTDILEKLRNMVEDKRRINKKKHDVWEISFDWKECYGSDFIIQKLDYMHNNPNSKKWTLCDSPEKYSHSSAMFYMKDVQGIYHVTSFMAMEDIDLSKSII